VCTCEHVRMTNPVTTRVSSIAEFPRLSFALCCALGGFLLGCAGLQRGKFSIVDRDFELIAETSLKKIDPHRDIIAIVTPSDIDPRARKALAGLRPLIAPDQVPASNESVLPQGYFLLQAFRVELDGAVFEGQLGPITRKLTKAALPDCGKIYSVPFFLNGTDWFNPNYKVTTCDERRVWWPAGEAPPQDIPPREDAASIP